jgi:transcriptional regulator of acetoin/glycerol metabolism
VIATTNRPLTTLVQEGRFRADLYARLAQWTIPLPPLRERREDVPELAAALLLRCDGEGRSVDVDLAEELLLHDWPLNVRGLLNVLSVAVVACPAHEPLGLAPEVRTALESTRGLTVGVPRAPAPAPWPDRAELEALIGRFGGRVSAAARELGVNRTTLYRRLWLAGLDPASFRRLGTAR